MWLGGTWDQRGKHTVLVASKHTALVLGQTVQKPGVAAAFCRAACSAAVEKVERWPGAGGRRKACTLRPSDSVALSMPDSGNCAVGASVRPPRKKAVAERRLAKIEHNGPPGAAAADAAPVCACRPTLFAFCGWPCTGCAGPRASSMEGMRRLPRGAVGAQRAPKHAASTHHLQARVTHTHRALLQPQQRWRRVSPPATTPAGLRKARVSCK